MNSWFFLENVEFAEEQSRIWFILIRSRLPTGRKPPMSKARRNSSIIKSIAPTGCVDGDKPSDFLGHMTKLGPGPKNKLYDQIMVATKLTCPGFLENKDKNRAMVPIHEKKRVKLTVVHDTDVEYVPATYANCERDEYIIWQAPTKDNYCSFWRNVWQDNVKIIVSVSDKFSESDKEKCYPYWSTKEGSTLNIQNDRVTVKTVKKSDQKGFTVYELTLQCTDDAETTSKDKKDRSTDSEEVAEEPDKPRTITLIHFEWIPDTWPDIDVLAHFVHYLSKKEVQLARKIVDGFVPPVIIQGTDGIGRTCALWVLTILTKDIEKRDCFDVEDLAKKISRMRPGALASRLYFSVTFAAAFRCAGLLNWIPIEESKTKAKEIKEAYHNSMK